MGGSFDLLDAAKRLIRFDTSTWGSNADCAVHVGSLMRQAGLEVSYQEARRGDVLFMNVLGRAGRGKGPLLLATHLDTVGPGDPRQWTKTAGDPWRMTRRGGLLYGLGVADTKLDLLCKLAAVRKVKLAALKRPLYLLGTFGEESGLRGAARFCQTEIPKPAMALVGEPTALSIVTRHKGLAVIEVTLRSRGLYRPPSDHWVYEVSFRGRPAHSSTPKLGSNALAASLRFLEKLQGRFKKIHVLSWQGGEGHNMIPASCRLRLSLGEGPRVALPSGAGQKGIPKREQAGWYPTLPWEQALEVARIVAAALEPLGGARDRAFDPPELTWNVTQAKEAHGGWTLTFDVRPLPGQGLRRAFAGLERKLWDRLGAPGASWHFRLERDNPALDLPGEEQVLRLARAGLRAARLPVKVGAKAGCSEAGLYARVGIPSVVFGPGEAAGNIHRPNEAVAVQQLKQAVRFYEEFLKRTCL